MWGSRWRSSPAAGLAPALSAPDDEAPPAPTLPSIDLVADAGVRLTVLRTLSAEGIGGDSLYEVAVDGFDDRLHVPELRVAIRFFLGTLEEHVVANGLLQPIGVKVLVQGTSFVGAGGLDDVLAAHRARPGPLVEELVAMIEVHSSECMRVVRSRKRARTAPEPLAWSAAVKQEVKQEASAGGAGGIL